MTTTENVQDQRPLYVIAREIEADHRAQNRPLYFGAVPYVEAMRCLHTITDNYGMDGADEIVMYALSNLQTWRGETARRVKKELNYMLKSLK